MGQQQCQLWDSIRALASSAQLQSLGSRPPGPVGGRGVHIVYIQVPCLPKSGR